MKPRILDLFCGEGGAAAGYKTAGFIVDGVDTVGAHARRYPCNFHRADALTFLRENGHRYDAVHASPPCQGYSVTAQSMPAAALAKYPLLIPETRELLVALGKPYIIENVVGAPLIDPTLLCGSMFDLTATDNDGTLLRLERHRIFESNVPISAPRGCHHDPDVRVAGVYGGGASKRRGDGVTTRGGYTPHKNVREDLMGVHRMSQLGLSEAIPPAYTRHLGRFLLEAVA